MQPPCKLSFAYEYLGRWIGCLSSFVRSVVEEMKSIHFPMFFTEANSDVQSIVYVHIHRYSQGKGLYIANKNPVDLPNMDVDVGIN